MHRIPICPSAAVQVVVGKVMVLVCGKENVLKEDGKQKGRDVRRMVEMGEGERERENIGTLS